MESSDKGEEVDIKVMLPLFQRSVVSDFSYRLEDSGVQDDSVDRVVLPLSFLKNLSE